MSLYVREAGPVDAPAVLFLHGLGLSGAMWQPQFERLADFYHCLAPDLPECGHSAAIGPFTLKDAAGSVASVIRERVPGGCAHVIGLSLGGAVALQMLREEPQVVDHLLISGASRELPAPLDALHRLDERILHLLSHERLAEFLLFFGDKRSRSRATAWRGLQPHHAFIYGSCCFNSYYFVIREIPLLYSARAAQAASYMVGATLAVALAHTAAWPLGLL